MMQTVLVGLVAGAASALLFGSIATGSLLAILLFYVSALPVVIVAIGWSHLAGLIAAAGAAVGLAAAFGGFFFVAYLIGVGLPAWWLGYLALLARQTQSTDGEDRLEWYPAGHLVFWCALLSALVIVCTIPNFGLDAESFRKELRKLFENIIRVQYHIPADTAVELPGVSDAGAVLDFLVLAVPPMAAVLTMLINAANLWLAGRIVALSGRLKRPWPDLPNMQFPSYAPMLLAVAIAGTFAPGLAGILATILTASVLTAYSILGLAVLHAITAGMAARGAILGGAYAGIAVFGWPMLAAALLGLIDPMLNLRARVKAKRGAPSNRT